MAQRNTENDSMIFGLALIGAAFCVLMFAVYALVCFAALILTIIALCALKQEITIYRWTTTPRDAAIFLGCGAAGLIGLPVFVLFCTMLLHGRVPPNWWGYLLLGGYSFGAVGLSALIFEDEQKRQAANFLTLQSPPPPAAPVALPSSPSGGPGGGSSDAPFRFASWDDEVPDDPHQQARSDSRALTIVQPGAASPPPGNFPDPGRSCQGCGFNMQMSDEEMQRLADRYARGLS